MSWWVALRATGGGGVWGVVAGCRCSDGVKHDVERHSKWLWSGSLAPLGPGENILPVDYVPFPVRDKTGVVCVFQGLREDLHRCKMESNLKKMHCTVPYQGRDTARVYQKVLRQYSN